MSASRLFFSQTYRTVATSFFIGIALLTGLAGLPTRAHALFGVGDVVIVASDLTRDPKELGLDGIAWIVAKMIVGKIIGNLQSFTNQGFYGDPLIVTNPEAFFNKLSRSETETLMGEVANSDMYAPIKRQLLRQLTQSYIPYSNKTKSNIADILIDPSMYSNNFVQGGGWTAYFSSLEPQNNALDQSFILAREQSKRVNSSASTVHNELNQGSGLLSLPGKCIKFAVGVDVNGDGVTDEADANASCTQWERLTPGQFVTNTLSSALGSPVRSLENADEISEVLASVIDTLVNDLLSKGIASITSSGGASGTGATTVQQTAVHDAQLVQIVNTELGTANRLLSIRNDVALAQTHATQAIQKIDAAIPNGSTLLGTYADQLQAQRAQLVTLQTSLTGHLSSIDATGVTGAYVSSMTELSHTAASSSTAQDVINAYQQYGNLTEKIDVYARNDVFNNESAIRTTISNVNTATAAVDSIISQSAILGNQMPG